MRAREWGVRKSTGSPRSPSSPLPWTVRIPASKGDDFRKAIGKLGELRRSALDSQDVTDAYYDTRAVLEGSTYTVNGRKIYITNGSVCGTAVFTAVMSELALDV